MSYTYTPGTRPDALAILRDKGLLDTPKRLDPKPGTFVLSAHDHFFIGDDGASYPVVSKSPVVVNSALPVHPLVNFRALGWSLVVLLFVGFLVGLMAVGS